jgi:cathepsin B
MHFLLFLSLSVIAANFVKRESIEQIKQLAEWEAYELNNNPFRHHSHADIHKLVGTRINTEELSLSFVENGRAANVQAFDSRVNWASCVFPVRNQGQCGSCWAFAAAEVLTDRFCIASNSSVKVVLSPQDLVSCDSNDYGCNGGFLDASWQFLEQSGTVSEACFPYVSGSGTSPKCPSSLCVNSTVSNKVYKAALGSSSAFKSLSAIQNEIIYNGPLESAFQVYEDFLHYKSGIYSHVYGSAVGGHAIKVVGWGNQNGTNYWIVQNSWGASWGENGFFRIAFGQCYIDQNFYGGLAKLN